MEHLRLSEDLCAVIKRRIADAISYRELIDTKPADSVTPDDIDNLPTKWLSLVQGSYWDHVAVRARPRRRCNQILPKLRSKRDLLSEGETVFLCEPRDERFEGIGDHVSALLNTTWALLGVEAEKERAEWDSDILRFGVVEVGWAWERGKEKLRGERGEPVVPEDAEEWQGAAPFEVQEFDTQTEAEAAAREAQAREDDVVWGGPTKDEPFVERFSPTDLLIDPSATRWDLADARFAARVKKVPLGDLQSNPNYQHTSELKGRVYSIEDDRQASLLDNPDASFKNDAVRRDHAWVTTFDTYLFIDRKGNGETEFLHCVFTDENDSPLLVQPCPYVDERGQSIFTINPYPFRVIPGIVVDNDSPYPESAVEQVADLQLSYDESWNQLNEARRKSPRQYLVRKEAIEDETIKRFESGVDQLMIEVDTIEGVMAEVPQIRLSPEVYASLEQIPQEMGRQLGVNEFQEAILPEKDMLKAEVDALAQQGGARTMGDARRSRKFAEDIGMCLLNLLQLFADRSRPYRWQNTQGKRVWGTMCNVDLRGVDRDGNLLPIGTQFIVKLTADSQQPKDKGTDQLVKMKLLEICMPFLQMPDPQTSGPMINIKALLSIVLRAFADRDTDSIIVPDPTPEELEQIQMQQAMQAQQEQGMMQEQASQEQATAQEQMQRQQGSEDLDNLGKLAGIVKQLSPPGKR